MTGFGLAEAVTPSGAYRVEIRAVNNRFQEMQIRQPKFTLNLEPKIRKEISGVVSRGSISVFIHCDRETESLGLTWDRPLVGSYMRICEEIRGEYNLPGPVDLVDMLRLNSDFIKSESAPQGDEALWKDLSPVLASAVRAFQESREGEGAQLVKGLKKILADISNTLRLVEGRAPLRVMEYGEALAARVKKITSDAPGLDPQRVAAEVALMAERLDITEEITRLRAHIEKFNADFEASEPVGKRMGFLLQEMNREANTIGSKANDTEIAHWSVSLKENIEKIREQIQNIE
jgi:uncharacterized protein (TIGR00255 family)